MLLKKNDQKQKEKSKRILFFQWIQELKKNPKVFHYWWNGWKTKRKIKCIENLLFIYLLMTHSPLKMIWHQRENFPPFPFLHKIPTLWLFLKVQKKSLFIYQIISLSYLSNNFPGCLSYLEMRGYWPLLQCSS